MGYIKFDEAEVQQLQLAANSFKRTAEARTTRRKLRPGEYKHVSLFIKAFADGDATKEYILSRNVLRIIEELCTTGANALTNSIIPAYEKRISEAPDAEAKANYQVYLDKCHKTLGAYSSIVAKVQNAL